jgi:hypothetical protein
MTADDPSHLSLNIVFDIRSTSHIYCYRWSGGPVPYAALHADHEQNASTSTVRIAGSSQANPFACIAAGVASLWGPAHGGANEAVLHMLEEIGSVVRLSGIEAPSVVVVRVVFAS